MAILLAMPVLPLLGIPLREAGMGGIPGTMPLVQHLTLWAAFAGAVVAARSNRLLALSTEALLPAGWKAPAALISGSVGAGLSAWLAVSSIGLIETVRRFGSEVAWGIPIWVALLVMPAGLLLIAARLVWSAARDWKGRVAACLISAAVLAAPQFSQLREAGLAHALGALLVLAVLLGMPIYAAIGGAALLLFWSEEIPVAAAADEIYKLSASEFLPAIPLFALAGYILAAGGASSRLTRASKAIFGWLPGGLAITTVVVLAFLTPLTGASGVTILSMGGLVLPMLTNNRYPDGTSLGLVTVSGSIGLLLPPSLPVILYAIAAGIPIPQLFVAAAVPGLLLILVVAGWGAARGWQAGALPTRFEVREAGSAMWSARWELLLPIAVLSAYFGGYATLVETAALTVLYALVVEFVLYRDLSLRYDLPRVTLECGAVVGGFLIVVATALAFANYLVTAEIPMVLLDLVRGHISSPMVFLLALNVFLLVVGALMDIYSAILVVVPLILPIAANYEIDPVHLGIIFLANMELGYLMPPMGENLFLSSLAFNRSLSSVYLATLPYTVALMAAVLLITYVPVMTLGVVRWMYP